MGGREKACYAMDAGTVTLHGQWVIKGLHQVEIAINSSSFLGQSQTHRARGGEILLL